jgi:hypothetical protein
MRGKRRIDVVAASTFLFPSSVEPKQVSLQPIVGPEAGSARRKGFCFLHGLAIPSWGFFFIGIDSGESLSVWERVSDR